MLTSTVILSIDLQEKMVKEKLCINLRSLLQFIHCIVAFANCNSIFMVYGHLEFSLAERLNFTVVFLWNNNKPDEIVLFPRR